MIRTCCAFLLLALAMSPGATAEAPSGVRAAIDRWRAAISTSPRTTPVRSATVRGSGTEAGLATTFEIRLDASGYRRVTHYGPRASEEVCSGGHAWVRDWNGKVQELAGRDRRDAITVAAIESLVFRGDIAGRITAVENSLRFEPKGGSPFEVFLDPATGLPARAVRTSDDDTITLAFSDWTPSGGITVPFKIEESDGADDAPSEAIVHDVTTSRKRAKSTFGRPADGAPDYSFTTGSSARAIPFNFENDHLMVQGRVNGGKPFWFLIDTGAEATIINTPRMKELGLEPVGATSITGGGNTADFAYTDVARMEFGGVTMLDQRVGVLDLHGLERIYGMSMGGLLGYDFLSRFVVRVDYDASTIDLFEPATYTYKGTGKRIPLVMEGLRPHIAATITVPDGSPIEADLILDCGAAGNVNLTSPFVKANRLLERARKTPPGAPRTMAGSEKEFFAQTSVAGRLSGFAMGPISLTDVPATLMVGTTGSYASASFSGVVGQGVLKRFTNIYDYSRDTMILEPRAVVAAPFAPLRSFGATLLSDGPDFTIFTVTGVTPGTPAEEAGIKKGDVITAVDGKPASELRLADIRRLLLEDGAHRVLDVRRGEESAKLEFTVKVLTAKE